MMFIQKSILRRVFFYFLLGGAVVGGGTYFLYVQNQQVINLKYFAGALAIFLVYFLLVYYLTVTRPLQIVLQQMEALLLGREYKKIFTSRMDEIGVLAHFFNQVTKSLGKITSKLQEGERMTYELNLAAQLQRDILPLKPPQVPGLDIIAKTRPAAEVGGDNFDFLTVNDKTIMYIGDVTGHGVSAGLIMTMVNTLVYAYAEKSPNIYEIAVNVNRQLKKRIKATLFMTMVMLSYDHKTQQMSYVGCGHEHILVYHTKDASVEDRLSGGIALGMVPDNSKIVKETPIDLKVNDFVLLYTDGITEAKNIQGEMFGLARLKEAVSRYAVQYEPAGVIQHVAEELGHFVGEHVQDDDMTLITVQRTGKAPQAVASTAWESMK